MLPDIVDACFSELARGVEDTAQRLGYTVILCNTDRQPAKETMYIDMLSERQVDGIIWAGGGVNHDRHLVRRLRAGPRVVTIGARRLRFPALGVDDRSAIASAVRHLAGQGCGEIACIAGRPDWMLHEERLAGFRHGLADAGLPFRESLCWPGDLTVAAGKRAVERAHEQGLRFDALVAFSDYSALGAISSLRKFGVRIPDDVAVVGCDEIAMAALAEPPLSSLAFPLGELGMAATKMVVAMAEASPHESNLEFPFDLHVRASSDRSALRGSSGKPA
jgi:LacI family transcriptional regulator